MKTLISIIMAVLLMASMAISVSANNIAVPSWGGTGWAHCNTQGSTTESPTFGYYDGTSDCWVVWDGIYQDCMQETKTATFTVGQSGETVKNLVIRHLAGEANDEFQVLDANGNMACSQNYVYNGENGWLDFQCGKDIPGGSILTIKVSAQDPWGGCPGWGQVAVSSITYTSVDNTVPEFGVIAASIAMVGAIAGIIAFRRH